MQSKYLLILGVLVLLQTPYSMGEKVMRPKIITQDVWSHEDFIKQSISMNLKQAQVNVSVDVLKELSNIDMHLEGRIEKSSDPTYYIDFNTTFNLCIIMSMRKQASWDAIFMMLLREYGRLPEKCPVPRGRYGVQKFWLPESTSSSVLPELNFDLHLHAFKVDPNKERTLIVKDRFQGHTVVMDVPKLKVGFMSALG